MALKISDITVTLVTYTGRGISDKLAVAEATHAEHDRALRTLCLERKCSIEKATPGDTGPIRLLRQARDQAEKSLVNEGGVRYVRLDSLGSTLKHLGFEADTKGGDVLW